MVVNYLGHDSYGAIHILCTKTGETRSVHPSTVRKYVSNKPVQLHGTGSSDPLSYQVGGNHYHSMAIQPITFITKNNIPYCEANVIKYVCRHANKNGVEDLKKARQYLDMLIAAEYPNHKLND